MYIMAWQYEKLDTLKVTGPEKKIICPESAAPITKVSLGHSFLIN